MMLALAGGSMIFLAFLILIPFAIAYSYYTRRGSGINQRPRGGERGDAQAGATGASRISSAEEGERAPDDYRN